MAKNSFPLSIWERYFLKEFCRIFLVFLFGFYGLYVIIDYSTHSHSFKNYHFSFIDVLSFYGYEFVIQMEILVPFATLVATIKTVCGLNLRNELVALMISGIKLRRLLMPFIGFGILLTSVLYFNTEVLQPRALKYHNRLSQTRAKEKQKKNRHLPVQQLTLEDGSSLIFQSYDEQSRSFYDGYWIRSIDNIYRFLYLMPFDDEPKGRVVEHLQRQDNGDLVITSSYDTHSFPEMLFNKSTLHETVSSPNDQSISALREKIPTDGRIMNEKEARTATAYYYKLASPWICLLAIIGAAPLCIRFGRSLPVFFIYAFSLFGLVAIFLILDASIILAERQVVAPDIAIFVPLSCIGSLFLFRFLKNT